MATAPALKSPNEFDLRDLIARVWQQRLRVFGVTAAGGLLALGIAFLLPKWYQATAVILPPEDSDLFSNLSLAQRALTKFPAFGVLGDYFTPADVFKAILKSRSVQDAVIDRFDLKKVYKQKSLEKTRKELKGNYDVKLAPEGTIAVAVEDRDPKRAAAMAMAFLQELDEYNIHNRNSRARRTRQFLEGRVHETDSLLRVTEVQLRDYQEAKHTVVPTAVSSSDVQSSADLMARKIGLEVRIGVMRSYLREDSDEIQQAKTELEQLKERIATLPALQSDIARMIRDQKILEQVFVLLTAELEQARIRETMDTPTVQILDRAVPPERHSRPRRLAIAVIAAILTFGGMVVYIALQERRPPPATA
jgi:tyrosine-protein kinase Etk/Wzc